MGGKDRKRREKKGGRRAWLGEKEERESWGLKALKQPLLYLVVAKVPLYKQANTPMKIRVGELRQVRGQKGVGKRRKGQPQQKQRQVGWKKKWPCICFPSFYTPFTAFLTQHTCIKLIWKEWFYKKTASCSNKIYLNKKELEIESISPLIKRNHAL